VAIIPEIENWQSIKNFLDTPVDKEVLTRILDAGRKAPSAKNRQPWRFIVVDDKDVRKRIESAAFGQEHVGQAPISIAACTTNVDYRMPNGQWSYPIDLTMAVSFMMLQASAEGLGACVITTYDEQEVKDILTVPYSMRVVLLLLLGSPADKPFPTQRKQLDRIISYNHW
jgi:nitroreductase